MRVIGQLIAALFFRSYRRSERVYHAMLARGHRGKAGVEFSCKPPLNDYARAIALVSYPVSLFLFDKWLPL